MPTYTKTHKHLLTINAPVYLNFTDLADENDEEIKISSLDIELSKGQ